MTATGLKHVSGETREHQRAVLARTDAWLAESRDLLVEAETGVRHAKIVMTQNHGHVTRSSQR